MGYLPNVLTLSEGVIDDNANLAVVITEYADSERRKYCVRNSAPSLILVLNRFRFRLAQNMWRMLLRRTATLWFYKDISCVFWQSILSKYFHDTLHAISSKCQGRVCLASGWLAEYNWFSLGWMKILILQANLLKMHVRLIRPVRHY